ncbi:MAG: alpha/beta hydrolase [Elainellaceae cyanobacterium]
MTISELIWLLPATAAVSYLGGCAYLYSQQRRMIFAPVQTLSATPESYSLSYEEVWIPIASGANSVLYGWWIPAETPRGVILFLHGNASSVGDNVERAARFNRLGFTALMVDYRGYGLSKGLYPSEPQVYEDADAIWQYLTDQRGVDPSAIMIYGHSLGGAIAIELAARHPESGCLVVESSFTSIQDMAARNPFLGIFPIQRLLSQKFCSLEKVSSLKMPKIFIHGERDNIVPSTMSRRLYQEAAEPKALMVDASAGHENFAEVVGNTYDKALLSLAKYLSVK